MQWLFRLFFLERFWRLASEASRPVPTLTLEGEILYKTELGMLMVNLRRQLPGSISLRFLPDGRVVISEDDYVVATIAIFPKGDGRRIRTYVVVDLKITHIGQKAWFQLAFVGFKVRFRKSLLYPVRV